MPQQTQLPTRYCSGPSHGEADGESGDTLFAERRVKDSIFAVLVSEADGGPEDAAEADVLAEYHRRRIRRQSHVHG